MGKESLQEGLGFFSISVPVSELALTLVVGLEMEKVLAEQEKRQKDSRFVSGKRTFFGAIGMERVHDCRGQENNLREDLRGLPFG